jgi:hypothetical protein
MHAASRDRFLPPRSPSSAPVLIRIKVRGSRTVHEARVWQPIATAPFDRELELAVIDTDGPHALVFPCRRVLDGWIKAETQERIDVRPTHWRPWGEAKEGDAS